MQYLIYLKNFFTGHFGYSFHYGEPVVDIIWDRLPNTVLLFTTGIILSALVGVFLGKIASWYKGKRTDSIMTVGALGDPHPVPAMACIDPDLDLCI